MPKDIGSTIYAKWTRSVTLDKQEGAGGSGSATYVYGGGCENVAAPTLNGWTFLGYCAEQPGESTPGNVNRYIKADGTSTKRTNDSKPPAKLYAWWAKSVGFNKGPSAAVAGKMTSLWALKGASLGYRCTSTDPAESDLTAKFPSYITNIKDWAPTMPGWTFAGYYSGQNGAGDGYLNDLGEATKTVPLEMPNTLYAKWIDKISLDKLGGTGGSNEAVYVYDVGFENVEIPKLAGWQFLGYCNDNPDSAVGQYPRQYFKSDGSPTGRSNEVGKMYAWWVKEVTLDKGAQDATAGKLEKIWALKGWQLGYRCFSGTETEKELRQKFPSYITNTIGWAPTRSGWAFDGYYAKANGGGNRYVVAAGSGDVSIPVDMPSTIYAKWMPNTYTVTFTANGSSFAEDANLQVKPIMGQTWYNAGGLPAVERPGYEFAGWFDAEGNKVWDANGVCVKGPYWSDADIKGTWIYPGDVTVEARWMAESYKVSFDPGPDGTLDPRLEPPITVKTGKTDYCSYGYLVPQRDGLRFHRMVRCGRQPGMGR